jgi:nucleoside 2-deoxyribosyltransferase
MQNIYLAGPITGLTFGEATDWRKCFDAVFEQKLNDTYDQPFGPPASDVRILSPMRCKDYLAPLGKIDHVQPEAFALSTSRAIMTRDFYDCTRADLVVVNLWGAETVSVGTVMEIAWAYQKRTPLIAIMEKTGNKHSHPMINEAIGFRVETIEEAVQTAIAVLWP